MASFNKVILIGNVVANPELRQTASGTSVTSFSLAVNRRFRQENSQACDFFTVVAWRQQAEFVCRYFKKGQPILICGQLQTRSWTDNQGQKHYAMEIVADEAGFVASAAESPTNPANQGIVGATQGTAYMPEAYQTQAKFEEIPDCGDLPF